MKEPITLEDFQGHLVLYCKGWYNTKNDVDFFDGLKRIWAVRCGYDYKPNEGDRVLEYIADSMFEIIIDCKRINSTKEMKWLMDVIHKGVSDQAFWKPKNMTPTRALIWEYRTMISNLHIKERPEGKKRHVPIVKLPKPMKRVFKRIINGNGRYEDYNLITKH